MADRFLLMWLEGPMQSWGSDSRYGRRETQFFPTKSGISGLLLSALGAGGSQTELLKVLSAARMDVIAYQYTRDKQVLAEKPELLRDKSPCFERADMTPRTNARQKDQLNPVRTRRTLAQRSSASSPLRAMSASASHTCTGEGRM